MAQYQQKKNSELSRSLFNECFKDLTNEEKFKLAESLSKIQEVCKL